MRLVLTCGVFCAICFGSLLGCGGEEKSSEESQMTGRVPAGGIVATGGSVEEKKAAMMKGAMKKAGGRMPGKAGQ